MKNFAIALALVGFVASPALATGGSHKSRSVHHGNDDRSHHSGRGGKSHHHGGGTVHGGSGGNGYGYGGSVGNVSSSTSNSNNANNSSQNVANVSVTGDNYHQRRIPVATAYAAPLTSGIDTCLGSTSGGVQTGIFGLSLGKTNHDKTCERIKLARELNGIGFSQEGCEVLRQDPRIAAAFAATGRTCAAQVIVAPIYYQPIRYPRAPKVSPNRRGERG